MRGADESLLGEAWRPRATRSRAKVEGVKPCLRAFWEERALACGERGRVERMALARLAVIPHVGPGGQRDGG